MIYQMMFAVITPALITGAFAERFRFSTYLVFTLLWAFSCTTRGHWVWGSEGGSGTWRPRLRGGTVRPYHSGVSALAAALVVGNARDSGRTTCPPQPSDDRPGAAILWFGWFGFNAAARSLRANCRLGLRGDHIAAPPQPSRGPSWNGSPRKLRSSGGIGMRRGLVAITPASGFVTPLAALLIGAAQARSATAPSCSRAARIRRLADVVESIASADPRALATGLFATVAVNRPARTASSTATRNSSRSRRSPPGSPSSTPSS